MPAKKKQLPQSDVNTIYTALQEAVRPGMSGWGSFVDLVEAGKEAYPKELRALNEVLGAASVYKTRPSVDRLTALQQTWIDCFGSVHELLGQQFP